MPSPPKFYITTPIYYVNDRPHIGHVYSTTVADIIARYHRLLGEDVFFLTGTDEHAAKVADAAAERGQSAQQWADENAKVFQETFSNLQMTHNDFIRTSQQRHKKLVTRYVTQLIDSGDVYAGEYEGWYDVGQEEYVTENKARESNYKSPINGKPMVRKREKNYFFKLSQYQDALLDLIENSDPPFVAPEARRNEVIARIREGLNDVPISRTGTGGWGIAIPTDSEQTIYVWIDALFNYLSTVDTDDRRDYWPASVHLIAKDILWFHAVIWPAMLMALKRPLPQKIYAHSFWISEGQKMSKSLGNFIDLEKIDTYINEFGLDALRYFLAAEGPMGATDANFAHARFAKVYNSDLVNTVGNCLSRVTNMTNRYFGGKLPEGSEREKINGIPRVNADGFASSYQKRMENLELSAAVGNALLAVSQIDEYIEQEQPFKKAKDRSNLPQVGNVLYNCTEGLRIVSLMLWPIMPTKMESLWQRLSCQHYTQALAHSGRGDLKQWAQWGALQPGTTITQGDPLFPRIK